MTSSPLELLQQHFLKNFADGDTWEEADALSLTKHGGLDVAEYFYNLGRKEREQEIVEMIKEAIRHAKDKTADQELARILSSLTKD